MGLFARRRRDGQEATGVPGVEASSGSIAAGGNIVGSVAQHIEHGIVFPPEAFGPIADVPAPARLRNVPKTGLFVGRADALDRLDDAFSTPGDVVVQAVHGLGGIGKSTLAAHWAAHRFTGNPRWWITANRREAVETGLADLAVALQPAFDGLPEGFLVKRATQWLATHDDWLIVLDNVERLDHVRFLLGRVPTGRFLLTTRRATGWSGLATTLRLEVLDETESVDLFTRILNGVNQAEADDVAALCAELGQLPLAVEQAASYCAETGTSPRIYLSMLAQYPAQMFADTVEGGDAERTVARIWRITLDRLTDTPLAGDILRILAWYAPNGIPRTLLDDLAPAPALAKAIGRLIAYSMITDTGGGTLAVHRLVQALARTPDQDDPHRRTADIDQARDQATTRLNSDFPPAFESPQVWPQCRVLIPHVDALAKHAPAERDTDGTAFLLGETGRFLLAAGTIGRATEHLHRALVGCTKLSGEDHPNTLISRNNLAYAYKSAGDLSRALPLYERTLADSVRVLGEDQPATLTFRNNLAGAYESAGDLVRAVPLFERTLADRVRVLGEDHPDTLTTRNDLAGAYRSAGDLVRAVPLYERTLADSVRVLGEDHPNTLTTRNDLARAYRYAGDLRRAVPLFERTLADRVRVLGEDHPDTLTTRNDLAYAFGLAGDLSRSVLLYERTVADSVRVLGEDHPDTLILRHNLAGAYASAGDLRRAVPLYERTLADSVRVLGEEHPTTRALQAHLDAAIPR
jgi:tetratricopeptide (TPR) repeat protein